MHKELVDFHFIGLEFRPSPFEFWKKQKEGAIEFNVKVFLVIKNCWWRITLLPLTQGFEFNSHYQSEDIFGTWSVNTSINAQRTIRPVLTLMSSWSPTYWAAITWATITVTIFMTTLYIALEKELKGFWWFYSYCH